jgi:hypothetical protein
MGAIFMTENTSSGTRTRHIDTRWHFVRELVEDKVLEIVFVKSADNKSDGFTKNVSGDIHEAHVGDYVWDKTEVLSLAAERFSMSGRVSRDQDDSHGDMTESGIQEGSGLALKVPKGVSLKEVSLKVSFKDDVASADLSA